MARDTSERRQDEYRALSAFLDYFGTHVWGIAPDSPAHPTKVGHDILRRVGMSKALAGLRQAVNDAIEATTHLDIEGVRRLDRALAERRIITLSELRRRYWRKYRSVIVRRSIRNDTEYHLVVGVLNDTACAIPEHERAALQLSVEEYEARSA
jgi:Glu-tRNA(Gln) amidotransferase subunit E-like FAD-binding protein